MSVTVDSLAKQYGDQRAVDGISFRVSKGEVIGFLGPNGAGKSTTMKMLTGFLTPTEGRAVVAGLDVTDKPLEVKQKVGYLPEHNPLYADLYIKEYLSFVADVHRIRGKHKSQRIKELIELTGLQIEQHKKIGALSKGYRQRVGLAQALMHDPEVIILDEPTSGLDPNQIIEIRNLIKGLGTEKTVILSTHIMQEVQEMCSRVIIINRGRIVADDDTAKLTQRVRGKRIVKVAFKNPVTANDLQTIDGVEKAEKGTEAWHLMSPLESDIREAVFDFAVETQNPIMQLDITAEKLEDVFRNLTKAKLDELAAEKRA